MEEKHEKLVRWYLCFNGYLTALGRCIPLLRWSSTSFCGRLLTGSMIPPGYSGRARS
jgi:hypothetical protein